MNLVYTIHKNTLRRLGNDWSTNCEDFVEYVVQNYFSFTKINISTTVKLDVAFTIML